MTKHPQRIRFLGLTLERVGEWTWRTELDAPIRAELRRWGPTKKWSCSVGSSTLDVRVGRRPTRRAAQDAMRRKLRRVRDELEGLL